VSTILVIEDSDGQRAEVRAALESCGLFDRVLEANDGIQGLKLLLSEEPDLVLCDLEMPRLDGDKLLRMACGSGSDSPMMPFLVLTAVTDPERRARLLECGASDVITKPFHTADLIARIGLHLKLVRAQQELLEKNADLARLSRTDPLTALPNRRAVDEVLEHEFHRSVRYEAPFAVAMADVDRFKSVNDEHGHAVGDAVLVEVARTMHEIVRESDCGARYGGEEFIAVLGNNGLDGAEIFAERWRQAVESIKVTLANGETIGTSISIGIAAWTPARGSAREIVERADAALYMAKETGRNRVCVESDEGID